MKDEGGIFFFSLLTFHIFTKAHFALKFVFFLLFYPYQRRINSRKGRCLRNFYTFSEVFKITHWPAHSQ